MPISVKLIVYDLDGTLVDTREEIANSANTMRAQVGLPPLPVLAKERSW